MPFGLRNGGNTYQGLMDQILEDLPFCFVYGDSILIFSKDLNPQVEHLQDIFLLCHEYGLTIGLPKCLFAFPNIKFLGHRLSATDCSPLVKHSATISAFSKSMNKPGLQRFLGMINFYRKLCSVLGTSASTTTSFHSQSNGLIKQFHRSLKSSLFAMG